MAEYFGAEPGQTKQDLCRCKFLHPDVTDSANPVGRGVLSESLYTGHPNICVFF